ncbi:uncharacterized protein OCT59_008463 [Rhizophagus irregularis]|uniref:uncharacterized protein n=1 Tax=Rhizophagus irregularis TaxID=588596 RepID=UPI0033349DA2|nr:hypothetical protein OCT59_008463 [Rhizophagus irregularis]
MAKKYSTNNEAFLVLHGISQNPDTNDYILVQNNSINITNWISSGNEKIDDFIQKVQLKVIDYNNTILEWIPYNQFNKIKLIGKNNFMTIYSAIWKNGPLHCNDWNDEYTRDSNKEVTLKFLHNLLQDPIESVVINEAKKYPTKNKAFLILYGISQNPDTNDYILVQNNSINLSNWISGNEKIDYLIQEMQLKISDYDDTVLEWIPYDQLNRIEETGENSFMTVYSAIWRNGPLHKKDELSKNYTRDSNKEVALKCWHNLQDPIDFVVNEVKKYSIKKEAFLKLYGISLNPDTNNYILIQNNPIALTNWISKNEKIDYFIQEMHLNIRDYNNAIFEWIPYNQFNKIEETGKIGFMTVYSAIWKDGPLYNRKNQWNEYYYTRDSNKEVALKFLHNSQNSIEFVINEAKKYSTNNKAFLTLYGISQNPNTNNYILVQDNSINFTNWISGNEKIDYFIQEMQSKVSDYNNSLLEWIPYNQLNEIEETGKNRSMTIYSAIWKDGPLYWKNKWSIECSRDSNKEVALKCLRNSQDSIDFVINEVKNYSMKKFDYEVLKVYGISQNPDTNDYILVFNWTSGNKKVDDFIQEMQLKVRANNDTILEWIPYNQFDKIEETGKNSFMTVYSAIWKKGPLCYNDSDTRESNKEVAIKCLHNLQDPIEFVILNEAKKYSTKSEAFFILYGISQNPNTNDYILIQNNSINLTNWISGNEKIDNFIQRMQLRINDYDDTVLEWIPYNQFDKIEETGKNNFMTIYSAVWKDGPLHKMDWWSKHYTRDSNKEVALKCLHGLQDPIEFIINEAKKYSTENKSFFILENIWSKDYARHSNKEVALKCLHNLQDPIECVLNEARKYSAKNNSFLILYGISQNPDTNDYILVLNWISGNEKIDNFIQKMQLKVSDYDDIVLEWIPCHQFNIIEETGKNRYMTIYSAIWSNGPLYKENMWSIDYSRDLNKEVSLKCLHNLQDPIDFIINEVKKHSMRKFGKEVLKIYGISQNPDTNDYILIQKNFVWISGNEIIDNFIQKMQLKIKDHNDMVLEWIPYDQFNKIEETGKNSFMTVYSAIWKDGPLQYQHDDYTRDSNKEVALKFLHNLQDPIDSIVNEAKKYSMKNNEFHVLYGISQNPNTNDYILVFNWTSGNEKIDNFIQEMQLKVSNINDTMLEWISYNQFNKVEKTGKNSFMTIYSAIWKDGPLYQKNKWSIEYSRDANKEVTLKCLHNLQNPIEFVINEVKKYLTRKFVKKVLKIYGVSQNPDTNDYILVFNWTSGNEKLDDVIQEMQLKVNDYNNDTMLEWIPYNHLNKIEETGKNSFMTIYTAIWKVSPSENRRKIDHSVKKVTLKCLHSNLQGSIEFVINEIKKYSTRKFGNEVLKVYGISQNPDTNDYILVFNWTSGNEKIDNFIEEMQLKVSGYNDAILEWIPYNQFSKIEEIGKNSFMTVYTAIWTDGPLVYKDNRWNIGYSRDSNKEVTLKSLHSNLQDPIDFVINEVKKYSTRKFAKKIFMVYGLSQNPDTNDYILVQRNSNWINYISGNEIIDGFIQEMHFKINDYSGIVVEWIPYNQFNNVKEIGKGGFSTVYSAKWKNGPLEYDADKKIYKRDPNRVVALKCLHNSQNITNEFLNEVKEYSIVKGSNILNIYGISQNPDTKDYIMVLKYAKYGSFNNWINANYEHFNWQNKLFTLLNIINGLKEVHQKQRVHCDFHPGNILFSNPSIEIYVYISDMGLCKDVSNADKTKIYGVMPYMAPEVLRGKTYTQAADIYSFGMIMYFVATGKQPFANCAHDHNLALDICNRNRPEINEPEAPKFYIDLMKKCWDSNPNNRPSIIEVEKSISVLLTSIYIAENNEIEIQFKEAEEYRKENLLSIKNYQETTHPQAIYTSRLLNPFTKDLNSKCLDCGI